MSEIRAGTTTTTALTSSGDTTGNLVLTPDSGNASINATGSLKIPVGTTAQRPTGASGMIRMNSTTGLPEWYDTVSSSWVAFNSSASYSASVLIVAGGGGGGAIGGECGGGGAGGLIYYGAETPKTPTGPATTIISGTAYSVVVGAGGAGCTTYSPIDATNGGNSSFTGLTTAIGGGRAGGYPDGGVGNGNGAAGGCGGGGGGNYTSGGQHAGGAGTSGQGYAGGSGYTTGSAPYQGGGGGGTGAVGANAIQNVPGAGGNGLAYSISGSSTYYGGGGGGVGNGSTTGSAGGLGGGGTGRVSAGTANTGGGGGAGSGTNTGYNGGSGVVIISYAGSQRGTGGTVTSSGGYTIHTFTTSGTYTG